MTFTGVLSFQWFNPSLYSYIKDMSHSDRTTSRHDDGEFPDDTYTRITNRYNSGC